MSEETRTWLAIVLAFALVVATLVLLTGQPARGYERHYTDAQKESCRMRRNDRWSRAEVRDVARCVYRRIAPGRLDDGLRIGKRESGHYAYAQNPTSSASGWLQYLDSTWRSVCTHFRKVRRRWDASGCGVLNARHVAIMGAVHMKRWGLSAWAATR